MAQSAGAGNGPSVGDQEAEGGGNHCLEQSAHAVIWTRRSTVRRPVWSETDASPGPRLVHMPSDPSGSQWSPTVRRSIAPTAKARTATARMPTRRTRPECPTVARRYRHFPRSRSPLAAMMKHGETVCEVHRAGRSRQGLAVQGCPRVGRRPRLLVLSRRRSRNGRGLRAGGAPGVVRGDRDRR